MSDTTPTRPGQLNGAGAVDANFLKLFSGEVLTAYHNEAVMQDKHTIRTIPNGKSASFPVTGTAAAKYHTPGKNILDTGNGYLNTILHGEKIIYIDDLLLSPVFIANIDEAMNHFDLRSIYTSECGKILANTRDGNVLRTVIKAARTSTAAYTGGPVGTVLARGATVATTGSVLAKAIYDAGVAMDQKNVPQSERYAILRPAEYALLAQTTDLQNSLWGGSGAYSEGTVLKINGITLVKSNQLPSANEATQASGDKNGYNGDYTNTVAVVFHKSAVGSVQLMDLAVEAEYKMEYQGWFFLSKYCIGHGVLRPESAVEITKA